MDGSVAMKKNAQLLYFIALYFSIFTANICTKMLFPQWAKGSNGSIPGAVVITLFLLSYALYSWKRDLSGFLKRFYISVPFSLVFMLFGLTLCLIEPLPAASGKPMIFFAGAAVCILLLFRTPNWKQHFLAILGPAFLFMMLSKFFLMPFVELRGTSLATSLMEIKAALSWAGSMAILSFFLLYLSKLSDQDKAPDLKAILIRSLKFSIALVFLMVILLWMNRLGNKQELSFPFQFLLHTLLAISFFAICYKFDFLLIEQKKNPKKNRRHELQKELEELYLEERAKIKRNSIK
jgi:hypothetical protein